MLQFRDWHNSIETRVVSWQRAHDQNERLQRLQAGADRGNKVLIRPGEGRVQLVQRHGVLARNLMTPPTDAAASCLRLRRFSRKVTPHTVLLVTGGNCDDCPISDLVVARLVAAALRCYEV